MITFCLLEDISIVNLITTINYNNALIKVQIKFITTVSVRVRAACIKESERYHNICTL